MQVLKTHICFESHYRCLTPAFVPVEANKFNTKNTAQAEGEGAYRSRT
jgi:hypothetical protein